ncbi:MAG: hypothetical protein LBH91_04810 [Prevotellaceae bacterium]|jgi:hypothetical protein|nr:hypothetical protein [Prevotellaceae bacterium]
MKKTTKLLVILIAVLLISSFSTIGASALGPSHLSDPGPTVTIMTPYGPMTFRLCSCYCHDGIIPSSWYHPYIPCYCKWNDPNSGFGSSFGNSNLEAYKFESTILTDKAARPFFAYETKEGIELYPVDEEFEKVIAESGFKFSPYEKYLQTFSAAADKNCNEYLNIEDGLALQKADPGQIAEIVNKAPVKNTNCNTDTRTFRLKYSTIVFTSTYDEFGYLVGIAVVIVQKTKPPGQNNYTVFFAPQQNTLDIGDTLLVDVMLLGDKNYTQLATEIAYDNNLLQYAGYENPGGWITSCTPAGSKIALRSVPSMNMVIGAPCSPPVRLITLKFIAKEGISGESVRANLGFASIAVSPPAGTTAATALGAPASIIIKPGGHTCQYCVCHLSWEPCYHYCCFNFDDFWRKGLFDKINIIDYDKIAKLDIHQSCKYESTILTDESARPFFALETKEGFELCPVDKELEKDLAESGIKLAPYQKYQQTVLAAIDKNGDVFLSMESGLTLQKDDPEQVVKIVSISSTFMGNTEFRRVYAEGHYFWVWIFYDPWGREIGERIVMMIY